MTGKDPTQSRGAQRNSDDRNSDDRNSDDTEPQPPTSAFDKLVGELENPMFVVTTCDGNQRSGCLVGFASQVSIAPPRFLVGLSNKNHTYRASLTTEYLAVHVIPRDHIELATLFGGSTGDDIDKFARCTWHRGPHDLPILDEAAAWFGGRILDRIPLGDHVGFLLEPESGSAPDNLDTIVTSTDVRDLEPGHSA